MNAAMPFASHAAAMVTLIELRGDWTTGHHQELLITLNTGVLVWISRNNSDDTFQVGAAQQNPNGGGVMNVLVTAVVPPRGPTLRVVLEVFGQVKRLWPRYDQADCQTFAQEILRRLVPGVRGLPAPVDDDFM
jgi:hypothetical protein